MDNLGDFFSLIDEEKKKEKEKTKDIIGDISLDDLFSNLKEEKKKLKKKVAKKEQEKKKLLKQAAAFESFLFSNKKVDTSDWKDNYKPLEIESVDIVKPEPLKPTEPTIPDLGEDNSDWAEEVEEELQEQSTIGKSIEILNQLVAEEEQLNESETEIARLKRELDQLKKLVNEVSRVSSGGGEVRLEFLDDVDRDSVKVDGKAIVWDNTSSKFIGTTVAADVTSVGYADTAGISTVSQGLTGTPDISVGIVTATSATFTGNVSVGGTLTYEDVTNIDSVGLITARSGIKVGSGITFEPNGQATFAGIITATQLSGYDHLVAPYGPTTTIDVQVATKTSAHRYFNTGSGLGYVLDGIESPFLILTPGRTYRFSGSIGGSHPFRFYLDAAKGTEYTTGVTVESNYVELEVTDTTPTVLHYQCASHGFMGNSVQVNSSNSILLNSQNASHYLDYNNFTNTPTIPTNNNELTNGAGYITGVSTFSGNYNDLTNTPTIPTNNNELVNGAGYITTSFTNTNQLVNGAGFITGVSTFSGNYNDLTNTPTIPTNNNELVNGAGYITGVSTFSGNYNDLTNTPTIPSNNNELTNGAGYITTSFTNTNQLVNGAGFITNVVSGVLTATSFSGDGSGLTNVGMDTSNVSADTLIVSGVTTFLGNVSIAGTLQYEDVTDIDSVGIITANQGINITSGGLNVVGVSTFDDIDIGGNINSNVTIVSTDSSSSAGPELTLYRNSPSPAPSDYIGQLMFKGENSNGGTENYAKITGKITDETLGTEDGLIETAIKGNGSFTIVSRQKSNELQLLNGVGLNVDGNLDVNGTTTVGVVTGATSIQATTYYGDGSKLTGISAGAGGTENVSSDTIQSGIITATEQFYPPSLTTVQRNALTFNAGAFVFNETENKLQMFIGGEWKNLAFELDSYTSIGI